jgi:hypothetical protein
MPSVLSQARVRHGAGEREREEERGDVGIEEGERERIKY